MNDDRRIANRTPLYAADGKTVIRRLTREEVRLYLAKPNIIASGTKHKIHALVWATRENLS